jgi:flavin-dependent dehydrogenase
MDSAMALSAWIDVLVLGGGPAGTAAAWRLASSGATVVVAERSRYDGFRLGETLPPQAFPLLARLGVASALTGTDHLPSPGTMSVWGSDEPYENDFVFSPYGHGWHLDRRRFDESLAHEATKAGAQIMCEARALDCEQGRAGWHIRLGTPQGQTAVQARWVIDATGRASWLSRRQGALRLGFDRLVGVFGILVCSDADPRTYIETLPMGWWYSAMLPGDRAIAVFFTDVDLHDLTPLGRKKLWGAQLAQSQLTRERLGVACLDVNPRVVSAASTLLNSVVGAGWLAVGDAVCTIDPLSSQGIMQAISSGIEAAEIILDAKSDESAKRYALGVYQRFRAYLNTRKGFYSAERRWPESPFWRRRTQKHQSQ